MLSGLSRITPKREYSVNSGMHSSEEGIRQVMEMRKGTLNIGNY